MAGGVPREHDEPLVAVEVSERDVGEEVAAEVAINLLDEGDCFGASLEELADYFGRAGKAASWTSGFAGGEFGASGW